MRRTLIAGVFVIVFTLGGTAALANTNNDQRMDNAPKIPCQGLYNAGEIGGRTVGTPGLAHVTENDLEMCHHIAGG